MLRGGDILNLSISGSTPYGPQSSYGANAASVNGTADEKPKIPLLAKIEEDREKELHGQDECETCKKRKYQDGSDEMVSFKSAAHISPESAYARVRSHEQEHVSNAYAKAATGNGKVISATVSIHTAICPECGRPYVSGGTTRTQIKYSDEKNPYQKDLKSKDHAKYAGINASYKV